MEQAASELQQARLAIKAARVQAFDAHPFDRSLRHPHPHPFYDDGRTEADCALVAIPGSHGRMAGIPVVDFFEQVADLPVRRLFLRGLTEREPSSHPLGDSVDEVVDSLQQLLRSHQRIVFAGASFGGFLALLLGSLLEADALLAFGPTTSLDPQFLLTIGDSRYADVPLVKDPSWVLRYGDPTRTWGEDYLPPTVVHYGAHNDNTRPHAERLATWPNVTLKPHATLAVMAQIRDDGTLRQDLRAALRPVVE